MRFPLRPGGLCRVHFREPADVLLPRRGQPVAALAAAPFMRDEVAVGVRAPVRAGNGDQPLPPAAARAAVVDGQQVHWAILPGCGATPLKTYSSLPGR